MRSELEIIMSQSNDIFKLSRFKMADPSRIRLFPPPLGPRSFESPHSLVWNLQGMEATKLMISGIAIRRSQINDIFKLSHILTSDPVWLRLFPAQGQRILKVPTATFGNFKDRKQQR